MINIMEVVEKEDAKRDGVVNIHRDLWRRGIYKLIERRCEEYPTVSVCVGCEHGEYCRQPQVVGLERFYCGIKDREWRK